MFGENLECRNQGAGAIFDGKGDADFIGSGSGRTSALRRIKKKRV